MSQEVVSVSVCRMLQLRLAVLERQVHLAHLDSVLQTTLAVFRMIPGFLVLVSRMTLVHLAMHQTILVPLALNQTIRSAVRQNFPADLV